MGISEEIINDLNQRIISLEDRYISLSESGDIKFLQGIERCIELSLRLHGIDSRNTYEISSNDKIEANSVINLNELSESTLEELHKLSCRKTRKR